MPITPEAVPSSGPERGRQVRRIFSEIAPRYDLLNHVLSLNIDQRWRRLAVDRLQWSREPGGTYLDACSGTLDLALELGRRERFSGTIVATDFAEPMLLRGLSKVDGAPVRPVCGDSLRLPFDDATFQGITVGFGVRNLAGLSEGLGELYRVLAPGGRLVVLEFTIPTNPFIKACYMMYFTYILPLVGRVISGHPWAYTYLPESVKEFPGPEELAGLMGGAGFLEPGFRRLSFGIAAIHWGTK